MVQAILYGTKTMTRIVIKTRKRISCCPHQVGDTLFVREAPETFEKMPLKGDEEKEAATIFLRITDLRIERLQDISEEDAIAEGIETEKEDVPVIPYKDYLGKYNYYSNPINSFKSLWKSIYGEQSWEDNPYVWVICFEKMKFATIRKIN